eukprot:scaffold559_cov190-Alexandrium_tamarense.AAC.54
MIANNAARTTTCFVYGTLMSPEVLQCLIGRVPPILPNVILPNHVRHPVRGKVYPGVVSSVVSAAAVDTRAEKTGGGRGNEKDDSVEGILLLDLSPLEMKTLDYFEEEGVDYTRTNVKVHIPKADQYANINKTVLSYLQSLSTNGDDSESSKVVETQGYIWARGISELDAVKYWDYEAFRIEHLEQYLETTVKPCRSEFDELFKERK